MSTARTSVTLPGEFSSSVHHNPVHHRYVAQWQDWPFSSAGEYLAQMGREFAEEKWKTYPILDYGKGWDDAAL